MRLILELRRRNVLRMVVLYVVAAWLIMQVAEVIIGLANLPEWIGPTILGVLAVGFPIALIFSWFYELTPEGISLEKDIDRAESITHITGRRMDFIVISLLSAAVLLFAWHTWWPSTPMDKSIAVLAFENMSGDPEQEYFSDGISEEILNALAHISELRVTARSSSFSFKGKEVHIPTVARQLGVANVLEGSVRKSGNKVRITVQLVDASNGFHVWSETYDRDLADIFEVEDEISLAVVKALTDHLGIHAPAKPRKAGTANIDAYDAYLRGRSALASRQNVYGAIHELEKAIQLDPEFAVAHAQLAEATLLLGQYDSENLRFDEVVATARYHAERALLLNETLAEAHAAAGFVDKQESKNADALAHYRKALAINPNYATVYNWTGIVLNAMGNYKEAFESFERGAKLDPTFIPTTWNYSLALTQRNRLDEAEREREKLIGIAPGGYQVVLSYHAATTGQWADAIVAMLNAIQRGWATTLRLEDLSFFFATIGLEDEAVSVLESTPPIVYDMLGYPKGAVATAEARFQRDPTSSVAQRDLGLALAGVGDYGRARLKLEEIWHLNDERVTSSTAFQTNALFRLEDAAALVAIQRDHENNAGADSIIAAIRDNVRRSREAGLVGYFFSPGYVDYQEGLAAYLVGKNQEGLDLIGKAVEKGTVISLGLAYLEALYNDPDFVVIRVQQEARRVREREKFLAVVCTDNPYADFWQPAEGTCERFAATTD